jgi:copper chaperone CopZ
METITLKVQGMTCQGCVRSVKKVLESVPGVREADVSLERGEAQVSYDPAKATLPQLRDTVEQAGYGVAA